MAHFILSAFADEASPVLDEQLRVLAEEGISLIELRNVDGKSCADLTLEEADCVKAKLDAAGVRLSALGSPFGKAQLSEPFDAHLAQFTHGLEICRHLGCQRIRMFSFYPPKGDDPESWKDEVLRRLDIMLDLAEKAGILLVHENEKAIYGDVPERCLTLLNHFGTRMGFVFDPANFVQCGVNTLEAFESLEPHMTYMHIKDAFLSDSAVVPAGQGDGHVEDILRKLNADVEGDMVLTIEPHLTIFDGLSNLQGEKLVHHTSYPDSRTAFHAACEALREILGRL